MSLSLSQFALNPIQWNHTVEAFPRRADPLFRMMRQPRTYGEIRQSGFDRVMLELVPSQTLQGYERLLASVGLSVAPGIVPIAFPEDTEAQVKPGTIEHLKWFDATRRLAEASNYFGLTTAFLCPHLPLDGPRVTLASAVGRDFNHDRLERIVDLMTAAGEVLKEEGIRGGLHNHVGTWIETQDEIEYVLDNIDDSILGAGFDLGHLAWAGVDIAAIIHKYETRLTDLHIKDIDVGLATQHRDLPTPYFDVYDEDFFREPGRGGIDLEGHLLSLPDTFTGSIIVEVDRTALAPAESARVSLDWIHGVIAKSQKVNG